MLRMLVMAALGIGGTAVVASTAMAVTAQPEACVVRAGDTRPLAATDDVRTRWEAFIASAATTGQATLVLTEQQATTAASAWAQRRALPVEDVRITFCPDGRIEASGTMTGLGAPLHGRLRGTLDTSGGSARVQVESLRVGALPETLATSLANSAVQSAQLDQVPMDRLRSVTVADGTLTLVGGR